MANIGHGKLSLIIFSAAAALIGVLVVLLPANVVGYSFLLIVIFVYLSALRKCVAMVSPGRFKIVKCFGSYNRVLRPGTHFLLPGVESLAALPGADWLVDTRGDFSPRSREKRSFPLMPEKARPKKPVEARTSDGAQVWVFATFAWRYDLREPSRDGEFLETLSHVGDPLGALQDAHQQAVRRAVEAAKPADFDTKALAELATSIGNVMNNALLEVGIRVDKVVVREVRDVEGNPKQSAVRHAKVAECQCKLMELTTDVRTRCDVMYAKGVIQALQSLNVPPSDYANVIRALARARVHESVVGSTKE